MRQSNNYLPKPNLSAIVAEDSLMKVPRRDETTSYPFRAKRLYCANGQWYFETREGIQHGPYRDKDEARLALAVFITECLHKSDEENIGATDGIEHMVEEFLQFLNLSSKNGILSALAWANNRLGKLLAKKSSRSIIKERILILQYAIDFA